MKILLIELLKNPIQNMNISQIQKKKNSQKKVSFLRILINLLSTLKFEIQLKKKNVMLFIL